MKRYLAYLGIVIAVVIVGLFFAQPAKAANMCGFQPPMPPNGFVYVCMCRDAQAQHCGWVLVAK
jgi:hypothetical protein